MNGLDKNGPTMKLLQVFDKHPEGTTLRVRDILDALGTDSKSSLRTGFATTLNHSHRFINAGYGNFRLRRDDEPYNKKKDRRSSQIDPSLTKLVVISDIKDVCLDILRKARKWMSAEEIWNSMQGRKLGFSDPYHPDIINALVYFNENVVCRDRDRKDADSVDMFKWVKAKKPVYVFDEEEYERRMVLSFNNNPGQNAVRQWGDSGERKTRQTKLEE